MAKLKKGFSLIEMVIYITILVFMLVIVLQVVLSITRSQRVVRSVRDIEVSAYSLLERIEREVRGADSVRTASSTLDVSSGHLTLDTTDTEGDARVVEIYLSNGVVRLREDGVESGALTQESVRVTGLTFRRFSTSTVEGIRTEVALETGTSTYYRAENFYSSALIR